MIAVDWGTSSLRGARLDAEGRVIEARSFARGILTVAKDGFGALFDECFGDWREEADLCLVAGMAGSRQGWAEAPYCDCPAGPADLAARLTWIEPGRVAVVPGLCGEFDGVPDVMRGEETQVFGALAILGVDHGTFVLPGTHSKWVRVVHGRVERFATFMTGEVYALLRRHSILAHALPADAAGHDPVAFAAGVAHATRSPGLLRTAFSVRSLSLFDRLAPAAAASYLSGLVIGEELREQGEVAGAAITVIGTPTLTGPYAQALRDRGARVTVVGDEAAWRGLHGMAGLLGRHANGTMVP